MTEAHEIREQAAEWVIRSFIPDFPDRTAFESWRDSDPRHAVAYDKAYRLWCELGSHPAVFGAESLDMSGELARNSHRRSRWMIGTAVAASLIAMIGIGASDDLQVLFQADIKTAPNQHITRAMDDGSTVELDSQSAIAVRYSRDERRIVLLRGQVFVIAKPVGAGETRPFVVEARNGATRALGTDFNVNALDKAIEVIAVRHRIAVSADPPSSSPATVTLSPGQSVRYTRDGQILRGATVPTLGTAWRKGRVVIDRATLQQACERLRRYSDRPIRLWSDRGEALRISGVFDANDVEGALGLIAREHGLRLRRLPLIGYVLS